MDSTNLKSDGHVSDVTVPLYNMEDQLAFFTSLCEDVEFKNPRAFISLILADWILHFQEKSRELGYGHAFVDFLKTCVPTYEKLKEIEKHVEEIKNEQTN